MKTVTSTQAQLFPSIDTHITAPPLSLAPSAKAWVGVVSKDHVMLALQGGFAQVCRGKRAPLARLKPGDLITYYSPRTEMFGGGEAVQSFTAIGRVVDDHIFPFQMPDGRVPFRRRLNFLTIAHELPVAHVNKQLAFTQGNWGLLARRGLFEISHSDMQIIAAGLGVRDTTVRDDTALQVSA
ncbi:MAG: EVE domain-containing protein [Polyangiaceae bacterium]|nr:EVE domain-containing protein [Myxococcales bacterium]MCB9584118.1 EVE domain-containing protein [Polyangiaceae bacterium]